MLYRISNVDTPNTFKTLKTQKGEYVLKGKDMVMPDDSFTMRNLKLYKKVQVDGLDTFRLVGKKYEYKEHVYESDSIFNDPVQEVKKELYDISTGELKEQSYIRARLKKNDRCIIMNSDVLKMSEPINCSSGRSATTSTFELTLGKEFSPMVKRILKLITKSMK